MVHYTIEIQHVLNSPADELTVDEFQKQTISYKRILF